MAAPLIVDPTGKGVVPNDADVCELTERGAIVLSHFHVIAQKLDWSIRCERCQQFVQGYNSGETRFLSVRCGCREYRAEISSAGRIRLGS